MMMAQKMMRKMMTTMTKKKTAMRKMASELFSGPDLLEY